jgi:uncharacterized protein (DUF342 family)
MGTDVDSFLVNVMKGVEGIIEEAERLDIGEREATPLTQVIDTDTAQKALRALDDNRLVSVDGGFDIRITSDAMEARADFQPPAGDGAPISLEAVEDALRSKGISHGVDWEVVKDCILRCNGERVVVADAIVARGTPAQDEVPACIVVEPSLRKETPIAADREEAIDYKARSPFQLIKKGDVLARIVPKQEGVFGIDVKGKKVQYGKKSVKNPRPGKNAEIVGKAILATCSGRFVFSPDSFSIIEVLSVAGDVDYSTGHIDFPGDVLVSGEIKRGFKIKAGGSLYCNRVIEATEVVCGGDLVTNQGILGRGSGIVKAGGGIKARFIENCFVEAKKTISISTGCLNSLVHSLDNVDAGARGVIVGGVVIAQNGVTTGQLGSEAGTHTEVRCGIDYTVNQKLVWIRDNNIALALKMKEVDRRISGGKDTDAKLVEFREKLRATIRKLNDAARALVMNLDKNETSEIVVFNTIYPGTYIEICNIPYVNERPQSHVVFSLDKKSGKVVCRKLVRAR